MFAQCSVQGATVVGVEAVSVTVEVVISSGLPAFTIVGMTDAAIQEAKERIKAALRAGGYTMPGERITVNLAPGSLKKRGSGFDLPIAVAILVATGQIDKKFARLGLYVGELSLDGGIREVPGLLAYASKAQELGISLICADTHELNIVSSDVQIHVTKAIADFRNGCFSDIRKIPQAFHGNALDFKDIAGHEQAKRAFQIAAVGNHGILMVGPPGSGKTMLASRMPSILPALSNKEMLEAATIHSVAGESIDPILQGIRPFRAPHHSASLAGLVGGGNPIRPGEISLSHNGVLFLDELPEFKPSVLQGLRQPMESGSITIVRAESTVTLPAHFSLVAAANPCPCGHFGDKEYTCRCTSAQIAAYKNRIGGPVLDRIDMQISVARLDPLKVLSAGTGMSSAEMSEGVHLGREYRSWRLANSDMQAPSAQQFIESCCLTSDAFSYFEQLATQRKMSGRAITRVLGVARTIADIQQKAQVEKPEIAEASLLRYEEGGFV